MQNQKSTGELVIALIMLVVFWPVGLYLLYKYSKSGSRAAPPPARGNAAPPPQRPFAFDTRPREVTCKSCGAKNTVIPGTPKKCEYCDTRLN